MIDSKWHRTFPYRVLVRPPKNDLLNNRREMVAWLDKNVSWSGKLDTMNATNIPSKARLANHVKSEKIEGLCFMLWVETEEDVMLIAARC